MSLRKQRFTGLICGLLGATLVAVWYPSRHSQLPSRFARENLRLSVERAGPSLQLLWDRSSPAVRGANHGVLHIRDGDQESDKDLTPSQLNAGSILYTPDTSEVTFQLDVYSTEPTAIATIQVTDHPPSPTPRLLPPQFCRLRLLGQISSRRYNAYRLLRSRSSLQLESNLTQLLFRKRMSRPPPSGWPAGTRLIHPKQTMRRLSLYW